MNAIAHPLAAIQIHERSITHLAATWREFAQLGGHTSDPTIRLLSVPVPGGYQPGFYVPCTRAQVVVVTAAPYPTQESAWYTMWGLLVHLHQQGAIQLNPESDEVTA